MKKRRPHGTKQVLVIEDNNDIRDLYQEILESWGYDVTCAATGEAGVAHALGEPPDVALVDLGLPGITGFDVAQRIRRYYGPDKLRLVAVSGMITDCTRSRAKLVGFDDCVAKPVHVDLLQCVLLPPLPPIDYSHNRQVVVLLDVN